MASYLSNPPGAGGGGAVSSFNGRTGAVLPAPADYPITSQQFLNQSTTVVTLSFAPTNVYYVTRNGLIQKVGAGNDFTIAGAVITFNTALVNDDVLVVYN